MKTTTGAASAAGFALVLILSLNCRDANAQQVAAASTYQQPTVASATMTDAPQAPTLQGASCGTIGPQSEEAVVVSVSAVRTVELVSGKLDGSALLQSFSAGIDQFKGKIAEKAFSLLESLQTRSQAPAIPSGYMLTRVSAPIPPAVF
jgi:hypothetical protein